MLDAVSSAVDTLTGAMGGNAQAAGDVEATFHIGKSLVDPNPAVTGNLSPTANGSENPQNQFGNDAPTEFVHFGLTHEDTASKFQHKETQLDHGVMFRDALERESLLLHGFLTSAQYIFKEHKDSQGALGMAGAAMDVLMGSGSTGLDPARFDELIKRVTKAGGSINLKEIEYPPIHLAGIDLHKARANYADFVTKMADEALKHESGGGPGGALGAAAGAVSGAAGSALGGVGGTLMKAATTVQKIVFKPFDIYLGMYLAIRDEYEDAIEAASYAMTLKAIEEKCVPTFHVWFKPPPPAPDEPAPEPSQADKPDNEIEKAIADAKKAVEDAKKKVEEVKKSVDDKVKKVKDFLSEEAAPPPTPGDAALASIFAAFNSGATDKRLPDGNLRVRKKIIAVVTGSVEQVLDLGSLPGFVSKTFEKITPKSIALLQFILSRAMGAGLEMTFTQDALRVLGRKWFFDTLLDIIVEQFAFLQDGPDGMFNLFGQKLTKKAFLEKGRDLAREKFGQHLDPILDLAMNNLGERLRDAIDGAREKDALTMEVLLARLPELTALIIRDTILPVYDLLFDELFGKAMGAATNAISPVKGMVSDAKKKMEDVKKVVDGVKAAKDALSSGIGLDTDFGKLKDDIFGGGAGDDTPAGTAGGNFPGGKREVLCVAKEVTKAMIDKVEEEQKVDAKPWPDPPEQPVPPAESGSSPSSSSDTPSEA
ncbi:MAG: hypothetical protein HBSAPP03_24910 [Phycisphaerae bacterium]|nr:MAG: hypothetical protein HBSAPP03_24910 [Phycisphaerae bacterium]